MRPQTDLRVVELLSARLCHDLIGPLAAIGNGVELLGDDEPEFAAEALALIGDSARKAARRLQFYRFAYGYGGGGIATAAPHVLVAELFEETQIICDYGDAVRGLSLEWQKLACNMALIGAEALARGGRLTLTAGSARLELEAIGAGEGPSPELAAALTLAAPIEALTSRTVGGYFTGLLAQTLGCRLALAAEAGRFRLSALAL